ncbi:MAG: hypothetical protein ACEY3J_03365 [Arsenophonus sp.]
MHNKFMIVDGNSIKTRSFNYTKTASFRNIENVIYMANRGTDTFSKKRYTRI